VQILMRAFTRRCCIPFRDATAKSEDSQFNVCKKPPNYWLPQQRPLDYCETYISFVIPIHTSSNAESLVKIGAALSEILVEICRFFTFQKVAISTEVISEFGRPKITKFVHNVDR